MKKKFLTGFLSILMITMFSLPVIAQTRKLNQRIFSEKVNREILIGYGNREGMEQQPFSQWFEKEYNAYQPDDSLLKTLKGTHLSDMNITIVLGTWCPDSRREVPRFFKVADILNIPDDHIKIIYVDRDKTAPGIDLTGLHIERVPTFIFTLYGKEVGRIIETPHGSMEEEFKELCKVIHSKKFNKNQS